MKSFNSLILSFFCALFLSSYTHANEEKTATKGQPTEDRLAEVQYVTMETNLGNLVIKLYPRAAPITVENFLKYVDGGFYEDTIFHRILPGFVVQGGGFDKQFRRKPIARPIRNESNNGLKNLRGSLSMARTNNPNSATSQFFINLVDNQSLDWKPREPGYAVFGELIAGLDVIDAMAKQPQGKYSGPFRNAPNEAISIIKAYRADKNGAALTGDTQSEKAAKKKEPKAKSAAPKD